MLLTTYRLNLDVIQENRVVIRAKQYDKNSRRVIISCTSNGQAFTLDDNTRAFVQIVKPDGTIFNTDCEVDTRSNMIYFDLTQQATVVTGISTAELVLVDGSDSAVISTMLFSIIVTGAVITQEDIISQTEFGTLANLIIGYEEVHGVLVEIVDAMDDWVAEELIRQENEKERKANEEERISNEEERIAHEDERVAAENARSEAETVRQENEEIRLANEEQRVEAENIRQEQEQVRQDAEAVRVSNEETRNAAEEEREALKEEVETKLANGEFDGKTVLYGSGIPAKDLGKVGDVYINTSYTELYPYYLFTKDGEDWTPRWTMMGVDGTDTLPILGTMFLPEEMEIPAGYEVVEDFHIPSNMIGYGESTLDVYIAELERRISALENNDGA